MRSSDVIHHFKEVFLVTVSIIANDMQKKSEMGDDEGTSGGKGKKRK